MTTQDSKQVSVRGEARKGFSQGALKLKDACQYLGGISPSSMRRLIARRLVTPIRALRHILIPVAELDRFIETGGAT